MKKGKKIGIIVCICILLALIAVLCVYFVSKQNNANVGDNNNTNSENGSNKQIGANTNVLENKVEDPKDLQIYDIEEGYLTVPYNSKADKHEFDWEKLSNKVPYYSYSDERYSTKLGIDVSEYQGDIDWAKVKEAGVEFAIIRLGFRGYGDVGNIVLDKKFVQNVNQATENGIRVGIYFFSQAITVDEAREEAQYVLDNIKGMTITYPICYDLEKIKYDEARTDNLTKEEVTSFTLAFCEEIEKAGYTPMVYGNSKTFTTRMELEKLNDIQKWYADYLKTPLYPFEFNFWQYSENGTMDGIQGSVDLNIQFISKY